MLAADRNAGRAATGYDDIVDEAREWWNAADEESRHSPPVGGKFRRVTVDAVEIVHVRDRHIAASNDEIAVAPKRSAATNIMKGAMWSCRRRTQS